MNGQLSSALAIAVKHNVTTLPQTDSTVLPSFQWCECKSSRTKLE